MVDHQQYIAKEEETKNQKVNIHKVTNQNELNNALQLCYEHNRTPLIVSSKESQLSNYKLIEGLAVNTITGTNRDVT